MKSQTILKFEKLTTIVLPQEARHHHTSSRKESIIINKIYKLSNLVVTIYYKSRKCKRKSKSSILYNLNEIFPYLYGVIIHWNIVYFSFLLLLNEIM